MPTQQKTQKKTKQQHDTHISNSNKTKQKYKKLRFFNMDTPSLKTITQAGGKLNDELNLEFSKYCNNTNKRFF